MTRFIGRGLLVLFTIGFCLVTCCCTPSVPKDLTIAERVVNGETYLVITFPKLAQDMEVLFKEVPAQRESANVYLIKRIDVLRGIPGTTGSSRQVSFTVSFRYRGTDLGSSNYSVTVNTSTRLTLDRHLPCYWSDTALLTGTASPGAIVSVGSSSVVADENGRFELEVRLPEVALYNFTVVAGRDGELTSSHETSLERRPNIDVQAPPGEVNEPSVLLSGTVNPTYSVLVNGIPAPVQAETGLFSYTLVLGEGEKNYAVTLTINSGSGSTAFRNTYSVKYIGPETLYKRQATTIRYAELEKGADRYKGRIVKYTGKIVQIQEDRDGTTMRIEVTNLGYGIWDDVIMVWYDAQTEFVKEDIVTFWGDMLGDYTYTSVAGWKITVPLVQAKYLKKGY